MPLHPFFRAKLDRFGSDLGGAELEQAMADLMVSDDVWEVPESVLIGAETVDGPHGPIAVRTYARSDTGPSPRSAVLWMHGGGFQHGTLDWLEAHAVSAELADRTGAFVVSVDYRLVSDEVKYPVPLDDVVAAWAWLVARAPEAKLFIGGASAGASLATGAAMRLRDEGQRVPDGLLLAYGVFHFPVPGVDAGSRALMEELPDGFRMDLSGHIAAFRDYTGAIHHVPVYAAPGTGDLRGMPPAAVLSAEYDELRGSSELLVAQLTEAGVASTTRLALGMIHGHLNWAPGPTLEEIGDSIAFFADFIDSRSAA